MAGNANSGRKTRYEQIQKGNLLEVCTAWLVDNFHTFDKETKIKVAVQIAQKGIVQKLEHSGNFTFVDLTKEINKSRLSHSVN